MDMMLILTEVLDWLRQRPKVRKLVLFVSCVVGLVCYALSSCSKELFENFTLRKVVPYIVLSLILIVADVWFTKPSHRSKAILVLVLVATCVYTHFVDEIVEVKPDAYILVSHAAFAIMSVFLSTLSHIGFEDELLYFFTCTLIIQLMKIKWWLVMFGWGFMDVLVRLRPTLDPRQNEDEVRLLPVSHVPQENEQGNSDIVTGQFINRLKALEKDNISVINTFLKQRNGRDNVVDEALHDYEFIVKLLPLQIINNLNKSAQLMMAAGLQGECLEKYSNSRRKFLHEFLSLFNLPNLEIEDIYTVEKIGGCLQSLEIAVKILFPNEKKLLQLVFQGQDLSKMAFTEVCKELATHLIHTCYALVTWTFYRPTKKLDNLMEKFYTMFIGLSNESSSDISIEVYRVLMILRNFQKLKVDLTKGYEARGTKDDGIHFLTVAAMDYIRDEFIRRDGILGQCFDKYAMIAKERKLSQPVLVERIINLLERSLEATSKRYNIPSLGYVFIMINRTFIARKMKELELEPIIGDDWLEGNQDKIEQNLRLYQSSTWDEILRFLKKDYEAAASDDYNLRDLMQEDLDSFKILFDGICNDNSMWLVFDDNLRNRIIGPIKNILLPAYENFITTYNNLLPIYHTGTINPKPNVVKDKLNNLFRGRAGESDVAPKDKKNV